MNEEIKEIFRRMNDLIEHRFDKEYHTECDLFKDIQNLLDYITNLQQEKSDICKNRLAIAIERDRLQQENKILKENAEHNDKVVDKARWNEMIYKSRCKKANDFIDNYDVFKEFSFPLMKRDIENQIKSSIDYEFNSTFRKKLKNILNGSDEN